MASFQKNFVVKNGLEVGLNGSFLKADDYLVGIAKTNPTSTLDVAGNVQVSGISTFSSDVTIDGNLYVTGSEVIIDTETLRVEDKNIVLGYTTTSSPSDSYSDGGGIEIAGGTDTSIISGLSSEYKTISWYNKANPLFAINQRVGIGTSVATSGSFLDVGGKFQVYNEYGDVNIGAGLTVVGNVDLNSQLSVTGIGTFSSDVFIDGQLYVGGIDITGGSSIGEDIVTRNISVSGLSTFTGNIDANGDLDVDGHTELDNVNISGIATISELDVQTDFDVYAATSTFHNNVVIDGNLTVNGTETIINVENLQVYDRDIVLGIGTTPGQETDQSANHGGIAIASTEGSPLVSLLAAGINTFPDTYKQLMWVAAETYGVGTTDAWLFNYAVGIGSTQVPDGVRLAVSEIQFTDDTINTPYLDVDGYTSLGTLNVSGVSTFVGIATAESTLFTNQLSVSGVSTLGTVQISSGIITASSGIVTYYGDGTYLENVVRGIGIQTNGGTVGYGITILDLSGPGISTAYLDSSSGIGTIYFQGGGSGSASIAVTNTSPSLPVEGNLWYHTDLGRTFIYYTDGDSSQWVDAAPFNVGIITALGELQINGPLTVNGDVVVSGIITAQDFDSLSDVNYKENIITIESALDKVDQLRGVKFDWKQNGNPSFGVIAQELEEVLPELVHGEDPKTVNYNGIIGVLIEAIKELKEELDQLKKTK